MSYADAPIKKGMSYAQFTTMAERIHEWEWFQRFIAQNPDIQPRWEQHKTYEILNNDTREIKA